REILASAAELEAAVAVARTGRRGNLIERDPVAGGGEQARFPGVEANDGALSVELAGKSILHRLFLFLARLVLAGGKREQRQCTGAKGNTQIHLMMSHSFAGCVRPLLCGVVTNLQVSNCCWPRAAAASFNVSSVTAGSRAMMRP